MSGIADLSEKIEVLQNLLIAEATGGRCDAQEYRELRSEIVSHPLLKDVVPRCLRTCRTTAEFWGFIKCEFPTYAERRQYLWAEFRPLFERIEGQGTTPADSAIATALEKFDTNTVHSLWAKAMERREADPDGAITLSRTLLETVCKHILDENGVVYKTDSDLPQLYKMAAKELNLSPSQHSEPIFKQILGGCASVVEGLGALRNRFGDAHGQGKKSIRAGSRHAERAVNLSGAVATFLVATYEAKKQPTSEPTVPKP